MRNAVHRTLFAAALSVPLFASAATNLLTNGSFESGLTGWTTTASAGTVYPVQVVTYGPTTAFGEAVSPDNALSLSPDAVGTQAIYFVDDNSTLTISQSFTVATGGSYNVGFSTYVPANGFSNPNNASFSGKVDSTSVLTTTVGSLPSSTWQAQTGLVNLSAGSHTVTFSFATTGGLSKDLLIDRVYVVATPVPEPESFALMAAGLAAVGFMARRRPRA